jgi:hypothetical protein
LCFAELAAVGFMNEELWDVASFGGVEVDKFPVLRRIVEVLLFPLLARRFLSIISLS